MNVLLEANIFLDHMIEKRPGYLQALQIFNFLECKDGNIWISAVDVERLQNMLQLETKKHNADFDAVRAKFIQHMKQVKIFSITGESVKQSLDADDTGFHMNYINFMRVAPDGIIMSSNDRHQDYQNVLKPDDFIKRHIEGSSCSVSDTQRISFLDLAGQYRYMIEDLDSAVCQVVADAKYILGPQVAELESKIAEYTGVKHCIGVSSGTDALVLALRAFAIKLKGKEYFDKNDEIITTPFTFTATGDAILRSGATPVFVDIDSNTYNIDVLKLKEYLAADSSRVVGLIPVHLYGQSADMDDIMTIAEGHNLFVLEDVAQAFGGAWKGKKLGSLGTAGTFSFFPSKNLGGFGDGGMVATHDDAIAEQIRMLLKHGGRDKYNVDCIGYNARLDTIQAAILLVKLKYVDEFNELRRKISQIYSHELNGIDQITVPKILSDAYHVYHQYTIGVSNGKRDALQKYLKGRGIDTMIYYPVPLHKMKVFQGRCKLGSDLKRTEKAIDEILSLPIEPLLTESNISYIINTIKNSFTHEMS